MTMKYGTLFRCLLFLFIFNRAVCILVSAKEQSSTVELIIFLLNNRQEADELCSSMDFCFRAVYIANEPNSLLNNNLSLRTGSFSSTYQLRSSFAPTTSSTPSTVCSSPLISTSTRVISPNISMIVSDDPSTPCQKHQYK